MEDGQQLHGPSPSRCMGRLQCASKFATAASYAPEVVGTVRHPTTHATASAMEVTVYTSARVSIIAYACMGSSRAVGGNGRVGTVPFRMGAVNKDGCVSNRSEMLPRFARQHDTGGVFRRSNAHLG